MHELDRFFTPRSIAVIGASEGTTKIGGKVLHTLLRHQFPGEVYPVNPGRAEISGYKCYPNVPALPRGVDLALIAIPAERVPDCVQDCADAGIPAVVIFSSGFADGNAAGTHLQDRLAEIVKATGIRVSGPNAEGFFTVGPNIAVTFSPAIHVDKGDTDSANQIAIVSQSGGLGFAFYNRGRQNDLCFSHVVSVGNQVDLEIADYAAYLIEQPMTKVLMMYVESLKNPLRFLEVAERAAELGKPIVMVKVGNSTAGRRAAQSHTGALASPTAVVDAVFDHHGIVRADDQDRLLDLAASYAFQPLPQGRRVAIVSVSGGTAVWLADACEAAGLELPEIDAERRATLAEFIPAYGSTNNPVDITAQAANGCITQSVKTLGEAPYIDAVIVALSLSHERRLRDEGPGIAQMARRLGKPVLLYTYTQPSQESRVLLKEMGLHCYTSLQGCVQGLRALCDYRDFQARRAAFKAAPRDAQAMPAAARQLLQASGSVLCEYEAKALLALYGIAVPQEVLATTAEEAVDAATRLGWPVALKLQSPQIPHKTEADAIRLNLRTPEAVREAFTQVSANGRAYAPAAKLHGVLVQKMGRTGTELMAGIVNDSEFGPMVMVGMGGIHVEVLEDVAMAPAPLTPASARALLDRLRARKILQGVRGEAPRDIDAVVELLVRLSHLAWDTRATLHEFDVNPIFVHAQGEGLTVIDALAVQLPAAAGAAQAASDPHPAPARQPSHAV